MNISLPFIRKPVATLILNLLWIGVGLIALRGIAVREYPQAEFPLLTVSAFYPHADVELVESRVTRVLEEVLTETEGLDRLISYSEKERASIELHMKPRTSLDQAMIYAREALSKVNRSLPEEVKEPSLSRARLDDRGFPFCILSLSDPTKTGSELTAYSNQWIENGIKGIDGVSSVYTIGRYKQLVIALDHAKMVHFGINVDDLLPVLQKANLSLPGGKIDNRIAVAIDLSFSSLDEFALLPIQDHPERPILLRDIAFLSYEAMPYSQKVHINGQKGVALIVNKSNDANPLSVSDELARRVEQLQAQLPSSMTLAIEYDQARFIRSSLSNLKQSLWEAIFFVIGIVVLSLRSWRAACIPLVAIPISLIGTIPVLLLFGFSINTLTLLAMILATGLVVDDAIVVLENVQRHIERGESPLCASIKAMKEIQFAIIAMTGTLIVVYIPLFFIRGTTGRIFTEFASALASAVLISGGVALTLCPMLCARWLQPSATKSAAPSRFHQRFHALYSRLLTRFIAKKRWSLASGLLILSALIYLACSLPKTFLPQEDRGIVYASVGAAQGKKPAALYAAVEKVESALLARPEGERLISLMSPGGGQLFALLRDRSQRLLSAEQLTKVLSSELEAIPTFSPFFFAFSSPLAELESRQGNAIEMVIRTAGSYEELFAMAEGLTRKLEQETPFRRAWHDLHLNEPLYRISIDRIKAMQSCISPETISNTALTFFGGKTLSREFSQGKRRYPLLLRGQENHWELDSLYVTNRDKKRISLGALATLTPTTTASFLFHSDSMRSVTLSVKPVDSIDRDIAYLSTWLPKQLPENMTFSWSGKAKAHIDSSSQAHWLCILALILIYAVLAIQFESLIDPLIILITVPLACFGSLLLLQLRGDAMSLYTYIGLITLIGIITKHGIMIVEYTNQEMKRGIDLDRAIVEACVVRLRPILMTAVSTILGSVPLLFSSGYGAESRQAIGWVLVGGLVIGTLLTLFLLPGLQKIIKYTLKTH